MVAEQSKSMPAITCAHKTVYQKISMLKVGSFTKNIVNWKTVTLEMRGP